MSRLEPRRPRLFVAEDDPAILELVVTRLTVAGYDVSYARNGADALTGIEAQRPEAVILDINMPGLDGLEVLAKMKHSRALAKIPVMVLTAHNAPDKLQRALQIGAVDFMSKPFEDAQLIARCARLLRQRRSRPAQKVVYL